MKAKDLKNLIKNLADDDEVLASVDNYGYAGEFELTQAYVEKDAPGRGLDDPPYIESTQEAAGSQQVYILDSFWTKKFDSSERKKQRK
jgi:hypothetical protein